MRSKTLLLQDTWSAALVMPLMLIISQQKYEKNTIYCSGILNRRLFINLETVSAVINLKNVGGTKIVCVSNAIKG